MIQHKSARTRNGIGILVGLIIGMIATMILAGLAGAHEAKGTLIFLIVLLFVQVVALAGLFRVQPNQAVALTLFGRYVGSTDISGLRWANPFFSKAPVSLRVRNFESDRLKVNDLSGSPIEIACVVVWQVVDSAEALFGVDNFEEFVRTQSEAALRQMATTYAYDGDAEDTSTITLRAHADEISTHLAQEIQERLENAGVKVLEARITHLAYAPEIAQAMLQRQQAGAIIAARRLIVDGAVSMVDMALNDLEKKDVVHLDPERRAAMVSNLLVVLCADRSPQPVVNSGSLY